MNQSDLRCPQCASPVLATANYCVICGIRLPEQTDRADSEASGWETAHSPNQPISAIPAIEIPEFDDDEPEPANSTTETEDEESSAYERIPDVDLNELDAYLSSAAELEDSDETVESEPHGSDSGDDEDEHDDADEDDEEDDDDEDDDGHGDDDDEEDDDGHDDDDEEDGEDEDDDDENEDIDLDVVTMIDEGSPVDLPASDASTASNRSAGDAGSSFSHDASGSSDSEVGSSPTSEPSDLVETSEGESAETIEEDSLVDGVPDPDAPTEDPDGDEPEVVEEAIEMIDEGAPVYPGESTYAPDENEATTEASAASTASDTSTGSGVAEAPGATKVAGFNRGRADEPAPMISASYPASERTSGQVRPPGQYWRGSGDEDWVFSELERSSEGRSTSTPTATHVDEEHRAAIDRAGQLIDELVTLLPELRKPSASVSGTDLADLRVLAIAARGEQSFDDWAALRQVVGAAVGRAPDIETILQLSKRVDDIAALIDERDRLQQSFEKITDWIDERSPDRD